MSILAIVVHHKWPLSQLDVNNAFLHEDLFEEVYMKPPDGVQVPACSVSRLRKSLYGLKLNEALLQLGFSQSKNDYQCAMKKDKNRIRKVKKGRKKLKGILNNMWIENKEVVKERPTYCSLNYQHMYRRKGWSSKRDEVNVECETCLCDSEIDRIYNSMIILNKK
ncbi:hypothetical protein LIER_20739 [Lithospermum erythrorhizon]|uniref:Reverse transcriptase Ty1/copia-type domain-containing protein n=1 Tax=Lithospermum erythrorhizon TaxID=34254 RepID=A0AAV3QML9_LITER